MIRSMHYTYFVIAISYFFSILFDNIGHREVDSEACTDRAQSDFPFLFGTSGYP